VFAQGWMQCPPLNQVHFPHSKDLFQAMLHRKEMEQPHRSIELDKKVHIAFDARFVPCRGSEQSKGRHSHLSELLSVGGQSLSYVVSSHACKSFNWSKAYRKALVDSRCSQNRKAGAPYRRGRHQGRIPKARQYLTQALEILDRLGTLIEPDKVRQDLAELG
jgi:hypothetical protein